jgi:uncharacterized membrane protein
MTSIRTADADPFSRAALVTLCLLSFAIGALQLDARHLWGDEAFSVWASTATVGALIGGLDAQPPLYHLLLKAGRALWGESVFAIRFASLCCGVLLTPIGYRAARQAGRSSALLTAALLALSPMLAYFQQEARMYALAALLSGLVFWLTARAAAGRVMRVRHWVAYGLASTGALYSHFYTGPVLAACALALCVLAFRRSSGVRPSAWLAVHSAITLAFGGWFFGRQWAVLAKSVSGASATGGARAIPPPWNEVQLNLQHGFSALALGMRHELWSVIAMLCVLCIGAIGVALLARRARALALLCAGAIAGSCALVFVTASRSGVVPDFNPRYLLFVLLPLAVCVAGWGAVRATRFVAVIAIVVASLLGQRALANAGWQKSRYAELIDVIRVRGRADDLTVYLNSDQAPLLRYYGPTGTRSWMVGNEMWVDDKATALESAFKSEASGAARVWLVRYGFAASPGLLSVVERDLQTRALRVYSGEFGDATLALYQTVDANLSAPRRALDAVFGGQLALDAVRTPDQPYRPGDAIPLTFDWRTLAQPRADYTVFVHLRRADSGAQVQANDSALRDASGGTSAWPVGRAVTESRGIQIPAEAAPGDYDVIVGLYQWPSFERLSVGATDANELIVARVRVTP